MAAPLLLSSNRDNIAHFRLPVDLHYITTPKQRQIGLVVVPAFVIVFLVDLLHQQNTKSAN